MIALYRFISRGARFAAMPPLHLRSLILCLLVLLPSPGAQARDLVVFGEPTLESALRQVGATWRERSGVRVNVFVAPSDLSFAQIERGARCDVVFALAGSALTASEKGIVKSIRPIFRNSLMLIGRPDRSSPVANRSDPAALVTGRKLAIANPDRDPAGTYGVRWLREAGIPDDDRNIIVAENSAGVLTLLTDKMAQLGIVYATDAAARSDLSVATPLPAQSHPAIDYVVAEAMDPQSDTKPFLDFLGSAEAKAVFKAAGLQFVSE